MKKTALILFFSLSVIASEKALAVGPQYFQAMKNSITSLDSVYAPQQFMQLANTFDRIAGVETKEWLPHYYAAFCYTMAVFTSKDKKTYDSYLDQAESMINKADSLSPNNSEIITLKGLISSGRIMVDPMSRGRKYGTIANQYYKQAEKLDSTNPRPVMLEGQGLFYTPKMFGGGKDKAKPVLENAIVKFKTFKPESDIAPHWGQKQAEDMLKQCE